MTISTQKTIVNNMNNRELSWLDFNERVLQEATDPSVPLLQRIRFLGIFTNNQDEFIKVRLAHLIRLCQTKDTAKTLFTGDYEAAQLLPLVDKRLRTTKERFTIVYNELMRELQQNNISILNEHQLSDEQIAFLRDYYTNIISPRLVPLIVRKSVEIPFLEDSKVYLAVKITNNTSTRYAIIQIPTSSACPRLVVLPSKNKEHNEIIFIDDVIRLLLDDIFFMFRYTKIEAYAFKFSRDSHMMIEDDFSKSLHEKMEEGLTSRMHGKPIRIVYDKEMPKDLLDLISKKLGLKDPERIDEGGKYQLLSDFRKFPKLRPDLENQNPEPLYHWLINPADSFLKNLRSRDILLCYPYQTFTHFIDFLREAAIDPRVERIYITLYRTAGRSKVINALANAAKNGKKVIAIIELMARFDEEQNVANTDFLQRAGVKVIHGIQSLKIHSKTVLIERRESKGIRGYCYVGTGNFNENTAKIYSDFGLFTTNTAIVEDIRKVFDFLLHPHRHHNHSELLVAPYDMRDKIEKLVHHEITNKRIGKPAYIHAKFNSLTDKKMIDLLYKASQEGVQIRLIVRGSCCLAPKVNGLSENIEVISIVDKYLEHARMMIFANGGKEKHFILSADLMTRNLDRRIEIGVPIQDNSIKKLLTKYFDTQWKDNVKARSLEYYGENEQVKTPSENQYRAQDELYKMLNRNKS